MKTLLATMILFAMLAVSGCGNTNYKTTTVQILSHNGSHNQRTSTDVDTNNGGEDLWILIGLGAGVVGGAAYAIGRSSEADAIERAMRGK